MKSESCKQWSLRVSNVCLCQRDWGGTTGTGGQMHACLQVEPSYRQMDRSYSLVSQSTQNLAAVISSSPGQDWSGGERGSSFNRIKCSFLSVSQNGLKVLVPHDLNSVQAHMNRTDLQLFIRPGHKQQRETAMWPGHCIVRPPHHYKSSNKTKIQPRERSLQMVPTPVPVPLQQRCPSTFNLLLRPVVSLLFTPKLLFMISKVSLMWEFSILILNVLSGARGLNNLGVLCISLIMARKSLTWGLSQQQ